MVYWRNPFTGKQESQSFETEAEAEKQNALIQYRLRYERDSFQICEEPPAANTVETLESIFYQYLKERKLERLNLERTLFSVKAIMEEFGELSLEEIDTRALYAMQKKCVEAGNKGSTIRRKMTNIKAALNWARRQGLLAQLPVFPLCPRSEANRNPPPNTEEIGRLYKVAPEHVRRIIILGFMLGVRVGPCELLSLRWTDVDLQRNVVRVKNAKKGISDPWREVPIKESLIPIFRKWHQEDNRAQIEYLVSYKGKPVKKFKQSWRAALSRAGIERKIRPYDLRHGFATEAIAAGADYGTVAALMGHKSPVMVLRHYQHVKDSQRKAAIENMPQPDFV